jgi:hypothetical protein
MEPTILFRNIPHHSNNRCNQSSSHGSLFSTTYHRKIPADGFYRFCEDIWVGGMNIAM